MNRIWKPLCDLLWPNCCPGCNTVLHPGELVCEICGEHMILPHDAVCHICGKAACVCKKRSFAYDRAVAACKYTDQTVSAVIRMKRSGNTNFAYFSARILADRIRYSLNFGQLDCVMPVPMHPSKERQRGYNQAALIADEIASLLSLPCRKDVLYKNKSRKEQHKLKNPEDRQKNVSSFGIHDIRLDGMRILLCDDVLTTGSTMDRCAALLKQNGASVVVAAAAATTIPKQSTPKPKEEPQ